MERILFTEHFMVDTLNVETTSITIATQCDLDDLGIIEKHEEVVTCSRKSQTEENGWTSGCSLTSYNTITAQQATEDKLQIELETIFSACKKQMENKAQLAAKIKHADWLRKGQTLEDVIKEYFKDDIEIYEKAHALRLHFEHEKNQLTASFKNATAIANNYFGNTVNDSANGETFDYGDGGSFSDYYSSSSKSDSNNNSNKRNFDTFSSRDNFDDGNPNYAYKTDKVVEGVTKDSQTAYKSRPFKSPKKEP